MVLVLEGGESRFDAKDRPAYGFGDLREDGVAERFDDEASGRRPARTAARNALLSQPGG